MPYLKIKVGSLAAICGIIALTAFAQPPKPQTSEFFATAGAGFVVSKSKKTIRFAITLRKLKAISPGSVIEARFPDPRGGDPDIATHVVAGGEHRFRFFSQPVRGLSANRDYRIQVYLYSNSSKSDLTGKHTQRVQSLINQDKINW